jgi:hypothetical protein
VLIRAADEGLMVTGLVLSLVVGAPSPATAQTPPPPSFPMTLTQSVQWATANVTCAPGVDGARVGAAIRGGLSNSHCVHRCRVN